MILKFHGLVTTGDSCRVSDDPEAHGAIRIGEDDLVGAVQEAVAEREKVRERVPATERAHFDVTGKSIAPGAPKPKPVTFAVADERYEGEIAVETGWGYSEYTPMDPDELTVGPHNVLEILDRYVGQIVTVWIADEPFNTLAS